MQPSRFRSATFLFCFFAALACCAASPPLAMRPGGAAVATAAAQAQGQVRLPNKPDSLKFAVIGDNGTGERGQYDIGEQLTAWRGRFPFTLAVMMGDNIYGSDRPQDYDK